MCLFVSLLSYHQWQYLLISSFFLAAAVSPVRGGRLLGSRSPYLYRDTDSSSDAEVITDYYNPKTSEDADYPDFLYNEDFDHHRVVEFYSPLCPHCRHFKPHYIEFARHFANLTKSSNTQYSGLDVRFYAVSCIAHKKLCQRQKIRAYPSIKIFPALSAEGTTLRYTSLHPSTVIKTLGVNAVDNMVGKSQLDKKSEIAQKQAVERMEKHPPGHVPAFIKRTLREIFSDAYLSFHMAMKTSVFLEEGPLKSDKKIILKKWLSLLQKALPSWRIHSLLRALLTQEKFAEDESVWNGILKQFAPHQTEWSHACQLHENPYTCGLWSLFHVMTVGVVDYNANIVNREATSSYLITSEVADTLKDFIVAFFTCTECSGHFLEEYNNCSYDRCERLKLTTGVGSANDWKELVLWLLETHNGVNVRLQRERYQREQRSQLPTPEEQQLVMWPPQDECPGCWMHSLGATSSYNGTMMYKYMRLTYWPEDSDTLAARDEIMSKTSSTSKSKGQHVLSSAVEMQYLLITALLCVLLLWNRKRVDRIFGFGLKERGN